MQKHLYYLTVQYSHLEYHPFYILKISVKYVLAFLKRIFDQSLVM